MMNQKNKDIKIILTAMGEYKCMPFVLLTLFANIVVLIFAMFLFFSIYFLLPVLLLLLLLIVLAKNYLKHRKK